MAHIRPAAVAGLFYPGHARDLDRAVRRLLSDVPAAPADAPRPKAVIAPHAGYIYSGPIAASAYARLQPLAGTARRVVLIGPCHRVALNGLAVPDVDAFETPLGAVPVDTAAIEAIVALPHVHPFDATHREEHSLEVHLPFLQTVLHDFSIVPIVVGQAAASTVAAVLERLWGGDETIIVVSSDLSHYLDYETARAVDRETARAIEALDPDGINDEQACGRVPVRGLLLEALKRGLKVARLDLRNSGDTAGDRRRVVGYGAWMFWEPKGDQWHPEDGQTDHDSNADVDRVLRLHGPTLLEIAARSIDHGLVTGCPLKVDLGCYPAELGQLGASFVTLKREGELRGCIGSAEAHRPLDQYVASNGFAAAFRDSRFPKLTARERADLTISVSVLTPPVPVSFCSETDLIERLRPGEDGLMIECGGQRALFLPQVWRVVPERHRFVAQLKIKAGLPPQHWSSDFRAWRFSAHTVSSTFDPGMESVGGHG